MRSLLALAVQSNGRGCSCCVMFVGFLCVAVRFDRFADEVASLFQYATPASMLLFIGVACSMKCLHELGHGVCLKRFGGECHDIGVTLLYFVPTLYCDATDACTLRDKWQRAAVGLAGVYVELSVAALAALVWSSTNYGWLNQVCVFVVLSGSLSTVLFNANPFLKYDGYYVLTDVLELPNLRERAERLASASILRLCFGAELPSETNSRPDTRRTLITFFLASILARLAVLVLVKLLLFNRFRAVGLQHLGYLLGIVAGLSLFAGPLWTITRALWSPGRFTSIRWRRLSTTITFISICVGFAFFVPLPHHIVCPFSIEMRDAHTIYVPHRSVLKSVHFTSGEKVVAGETLAVLEDLEAELKKSRLLVRAGELAAELEYLTRSRSVSSVNATRLTEVATALAASNEEIQQLSEKANSLVLKSPQPGRVVQTCFKGRGHEGPGLPRESLARSVGITLDAGRPLCAIGDPESLDAVLHVNEFDIGLMQNGQEMTLLFDALPEVRVRCRVDAIASKQADLLRGELTAIGGGTIAIEQVSNSASAVHEHFEARACIPADHELLSIGLRGRARVRVGSSTLFKRVQLFCYRHFRRNL